MSCLMKGCDNCQVSKSISDFPYLRFMILIGWGSRLLNFLWFQDNRKPRGTQLGRLIKPESLLNFWFWYCRLVVCSQTLDMNRWAEHDSGAIRQKELGEKTVVSSLSLRNWYIKGAWELVNLRWWVLVGSWNGLNWEFGVSPPQQTPE